MIDLKNILVAIVLIILAGWNVSGQEPRKFSLREAQIYALEHNYDIINASTDIEIAGKRVKENLATGFPQVSASAGYTYYIQLPTTLIPAEFFGGEKGQFEDIQFGTKQNADWSARVDQLIFSGQYIVGLLAAKSYVELVETTREKQQIEMRDLIAKSYYPIIILRENKEVFDSTLATLNDMLYEVEETYKSGFIEDTDVDQIRLLKANMETTISSIDNQIEIAYNTLKYMMGVPADEEIEVTDNLDDLLDQVDRDMLYNANFDYNQHIDYRMLMDQEKMALLQVKLDRSQYYPTLSGFYSYQQNAMRNNFTFFATDQKWFTNQMAGIQLNVPIFSSGNKKFKLDQSKLALEKIKVQEEKLKQGLSLRIRTVKSEFSNDYLVYQNKKLALSNAEKIYQKTQVKYREGLSTSLDLSQTYNQYLTSQIDYLTSILNLLNKKSELEKELANSAY